MKFSIDDLDRLALPAADGSLVTGSNQKWYPTLWQRMAGCGPTVASNLLLYQGRAGRLDLPAVVDSQESVLPLMEYSWKHITPGMRGVNKTSMFYEGLMKMLEERGSNLRYAALDIPKEASNRPTLEDVTTFLKAAFAADSPVAFLNLDSGKVNDLDDWHWMTTYALEAVAEDGTWLLSLTDNGVLQTINLGLWLESSKLGGGFVYLAS